MPLESTPHSRLEGHKAVKTSPSQAQHAYCGLRNGRKQLPVLFKASFAMGIVGSLVLGAGMCLSMGVLGSGTAATVGDK